MKKYTHNTHTHTYGRLRMLTVIHGHVIVRISSNMCLTTRRAAAEEAAKQHHEQAKAAYELEHAKMLARRKASEEKHKKDLKTFQEMAQDQLSLQAKGHSMQAVPTDKQGVTGHDSRKVL
jgi:hypothetical protein